MLDQRIRSVVIAAFLVCLLGPGTAYATLKCQCNNGTRAHAMGSDFGDEDAEEACNDACSASGGGRVWQLDLDRENVYGSSNRGDRIPKKKGPRRN